MKILICGDSYCVPDPLFPGLHWSEKILNFSQSIKIDNLAFEGASNALISLQLMHGLKYLNPDFVILSFTNYTRYEIDNNKNILPSGFSGQDIYNYHHSRYHTNMYGNEEKNKIINQYMCNAASENFEKIKNYFFIVMMLNKLEIENIPFCFTLGGFGYNHDYVHFINSNYLDNVITKYEKNQLATNLWYYGNKMSPHFHVDNEEIQKFFALECIERLQLVKK
jgi:hypothetical protein